MLVLAEEYPSGIYTWQAATRASGREIVTVHREPGQSWTDAVLAVLDERVRDRQRAATCTGPTGPLVDLDRVAARTHELGAHLVIDGSQSIGAMPFDVARAAARLRRRPSATSGCSVRSASRTSTSPSEHRDGAPIEQNWIARAGSEDFARLVDYRDDYQPGARRFDVGQRTQFELVPMAIAALEQVASGASTASPTGSRR